MDEKMDDYGSAGVSSEDGTDSGASESAMEVESVGIDKGTNDPRQEL